MEIKKNKITPTQLIFMVIQTQIGISVVTLPSKLYLAAGRDGWISSLVAGLTSQLFILIIWGLCKRFPNKTIYEFLPVLWGKVLGNLIRVGYIGYFTIIGSEVVYLYGGIVKKWILPRTPLIILFGLMMVVCVYLTQEILRTIARFLVMVSIFLLFMLIIPVFTFKDADILNILPIAHSNWINIFKGINGAMFSTLGYELLLICYPYVKGNSKEIFKAVSVANVFTTLFYTFMTFSSLIYFSSPEMAYIPEPVLYMLKSITEQILLRPDLYFLSFWLVIVATSIMMYLFLASEGLANLFRFKTHRKAVLIMACVMLLLAFVPQTPFMFKTLDTYVTYISYLFVLGIPLLSLGISIVFKLNDTGGKTS